MLMTKPMTMRLRAALIFIRPLARQARCASEHLSLGARRGASSALRIRTWANIPLQSAPGERYCSAVRRYLLAIRTHLKYGRLGSVV